jgi:glycosyltransferase involved in cell wall biosynthesis
MDPRPELTVVIPTRNRLPMLQEALASLMQQGFERWEAVVVDDASDDDTWAWLSAQRDPRVRPLRQPRPSERASARNAGMAAARSELLLFLDDDDRLPPRALETHVEALRAYPAAVASMGGYARFGEDQPEPDEVPIVARRTQWEIWPDVLFGWVAVSGQCVLRASALKACDGWDGSRIPIEDHVLLLRLTRLGAVALLPEIVLLYRVHPGQWRPANLEEMMAEVREESARGVAGEEREAAFRILQGRELSREGHRRYQAGRRLAALALYARAYRMLPSVRRSPLTRAQLPLGMLKCLVGSRAVHVLRRVGRAMRGEGPGGSASRASVPGHGRETVVG